MKILGLLSPKAAPLAVAVSLVFFSGNLRAFGPGGAGNGGGANGVGTTGGVTTGGSVGGGSRGGVSTGGNAGVSSSASGARSGVAFSNSPARMSTAVRGNSPSGLSLPYRNVLNGQSSVGGTRPANALNGTSTARPTYNPGGYASGRSTGQFLYPGTNGSNLPTNNNWTERGGTNNGYRNGRSSYRLPGRYYYSSNAYGPAYAPYIGYYGGAYPYYNDLVSNDVDPAVGVVSPQYFEQNPNPDNTQPAPAQPQQPAPAPQNPNGNTAAQGTIPNNGPDSLVEAVQQELIRRGYFGGKVDAMFSPETKEAVRKFQADHHLAETGLINEATLHALQLD